MLTSKDLIFTAGNHRYHIKDTKPKRYIPSVTTICGLLDKPFLVEWAARESAQAAVEAAIHHDGGIDDETIDKFVAIGRQKHRDLRDSGAATGTIVHDYIKSLLDPVADPAIEPVDIDGIDDMDALLAITAFGEWYDQHIIEGGCKVLMVEQMVVHPNGTYCGTFDLLLRKPNGMLRLVDWKTSNQSSSNPCALYPEYLLQIAAYVAAVEASPEFRSSGVLGAHDLIEDAQVIALGKNGQLAQTTIDGEQIIRYYDAFKLLVETLPIYRSVQRDIRGFNKEEKLRREALDTSGE